MDAKQIAEQHIAEAAAGLDLADADDRARFRVRMLQGMGMTRRNFIVDMAHAMGATDVPRNARRDQAIRAIARAHLQRIEAAATTSSTSFPTPQPVVVNFTQLAQAVKAVEFATAGDTESVQVHLYEPSEGMLRVKLIDNASGAGLGEFEVDPGVAPGERGCFEQVA